MVSEAIPASGQLYPGQLYLCATPIGNLQDITLRVLDTLKKVSLIYAEDTRHTRKLLNHFEISTPLQSFHAHNEKQRESEVISRLQAGEQLALVSDAGLPLISDPGAQLVRAVQEAGLRVTCLPGASAPSMALLLSGLSPTPYTFVGFLPPKTQARQQLLQTYVNRPETLIFFEAPHRLQASLSDLHKVLGDREASVCRELTKQYEEIRRDSLQALLSFYSQQPARGEICLVVAGALPAAPEAVSPEQLRNWQADYQSQGLSPKQVLKALQTQTGLPRNQIYAQLLEARETPGPVDEADASPNPQ